MGKKDKSTADDVEEMREIDPSEDDAVSYSDSGHASEAASHRSDADSMKGNTAIIEIYNNTIKKKLYVT